MRPQAPFQMIYTHPAANVWAPTSGVSHFAGSVTCKPQIAGQQQLNWVTYDGFLKAKVLHHYCIQTVRLLVSLLIFEYIILLNTKLWNVNSSLKYVKV